MDKDRVEGAEAQTRDHNQHETMSLSTDETAVTRKPLLAEGN